VGSVAWAILFTGLAFALWRRKRYTRFVTPVMLLGYGLYRVVLTGACGQSTGIQDVQWNVALIVYLAWMLYVLFALNIGAGRADFEKR